jgi:hypothetical protein
MDPREPSQELLDELPSRREQLQAILEELLGSENVYFQPPDNISMSYPAIVYARSDVATNHADNSVWQSTTGYQVTIMDQDPDSPTPEKVGRLPMSSFERAFKSGNLNHDIYNLYF